MVTLIFTTVGSWHTGQIIMVFSIKNSKLLTFLLSVQFLSLKFKHFANNKQFSVLNKNYAQGKQTIGNEFGFLATS